MPLSMPAPLPRASPELDGLPFPAGGFLFPLLTRGSIPKFSPDEGKLLPGLPPCSDACRELNTAMRADE